MNSHYNKKLKTLARTLRKNGTPGEAILWYEVLRAKKFYGLQFNRQYPIENYIVDFICRKIKLVIEIDGRSHNFKVQEDIIRDDRLRQLGYTILRIPETDIRNDLNNVIRTIEHRIPEKFY